MKSKDIRFARITTECPEQYEAYDSAGSLVGYVRVRWGYCTAWCPHAASDDEVYNARIKRGWWSFENAWERRKHLIRIRKAIAAWWNKQAEEATS